MMQNVVIGKGNLAGKAVYANKDFEKDEIVIEYHLKQLSEEEYDSLPEKEKIFTHRRYGKIYLYPEPGRYVNHSNYPNTYPDFAQECDKALRYIRKGEMITCDARKDDIPPRSD